MTAMPLGGPTDSEPILARFLDELYRWNERVNLTSIPRANAERRHLAEVRSLLQVVVPATGARLVDIGSGGGVPGLVIAILRPDLDVTLVEADRRRAGFLLHAAALSGCRRVAVVPRRAEEVGHEPAHRERYDLAVSRATAPVATLCELALPLLRVGGTLYAMVTDADTDVAPSTVASVACGGAAPEALTPGVLAVAKLCATPSRFPRRSGVPARHPLGAAAPRRA